MVLQGDRRAARPLASVGPRSIPSAAAVPEILAPSDGTEFDAAERALLGAYAAFIQDVATSEEVRPARPSGGLLL
jgi:hypothetical protein